MQDEDLDALRNAVEALEHPSLAARLGDLAGKPIELVRQALPAGASEAIAGAASKALNAALTVALRTMHGRTYGGSPRLHKSLAAVSGAVGGGFGLVALPFELPVSTVIMLRSIMALAREEGEEIDHPETALACLQVFALGARAGAGDALGNGYFAVRATLTKALTEAGRFIAERGIVAEGAPVIVRFISQVASRFGVVVTQKLAAQTLPLIGALGGAAVNYAFISHFQEIAQAHFTVRRLERIYGNQLVRTQYERIRDGRAGPSEFAA
jgi:predicted NBD/HSP70 family sugar kinase